MSQEFDNFFLERTYFGSFLNSVISLILAELVTKTKSGFFFVIPNTNDGLKEIVTISRLAIDPALNCQNFPPLIQAIGAQWKMTNRRCHKNESKSCLK